jgi:hypothetical protein
MIVYFRNYQDKRDPNHGRAISSEDELISLLDRARSQAPFIAEFCGAGIFILRSGLVEILAASSTAVWTESRHI